MKISVFKKVFFCVTLFILASRIITALLLPMDAPDAEGYITLAGNIKDTGMFSMNGTSPTDIRAPFYPAVLACNMIITGKYFPLATRIQQAIFDSVTCLVTAGISLLLFGNPALALITLILCGINPFLTGSVSFILTETMSTFFLTSAIFFMISGLTRKERHLYLSGILFAICALTRPAVILLPVFFTIIFFCTDVKRINHRKGAMLIVLFFFLGLSPWIMRNAIQFKEFIPVSSNAGESLYAGNRYEWNGRYNPEIMKIRAETAKKVEYKDNGYYKVDNYLKKEAIRHISETPGKFIIHTLKKAWYFWTGISGEEEVLKTRKSILIAVKSWHYLMVAFMLIGIIYELRKERKEVNRFIPLFTLLYFTAIHSILMALPRYLLPAYPCITIYSSLGLYRLLIRNKHKKEAPV